MQRLAQSEMRKALSTNSDTHDWSGAIKIPMNPSEQIDKLIAETTDWRGKTLASVRKIILEADREIIEEWKWMGSPVWSRDGIIAVGNAHKQHVKLTFANGAHLADLTTSSIMGSKAISGGRSISSRVIRLMRPL